MRTSLRPALLVASVAATAVVALVFTVYERPGLGLAHYFYIGIILAGFAGGPRFGILAAGASTALFALGIVINPAISPSELGSMSTPILASTYLTVGSVTGYFANKNRRLLHELQVLAERDRLTGLPNTRAFERAITQRIEAGETFALLVAAIESFSTTQRAAGLTDDDVRRAVAEQICAALAPGDDVARIADGSFAILTSVSDSLGARRSANHLQHVLAQHGLSVTFGWSVFGDDGVNALALYRAADERLYARRVIERDPGVAPLAHLQTVR